MTENDHRKRKDMTVNVASLFAKVTVSPTEVLVSSDSCLVQSVLSLENKTDDGLVIKLIIPAWTEIIDLILKDPKIMHQISPRKWEEIIAGAYDKAGFDEVILTPQSMDRGRDVIATKKGWGSIRIIDQVKAYKPGHLVTADNVRSLLGVLHADHSATKGIVTTTSDFAPKIHNDPFIQPFIPYRLELINGVRLVEYLSSLLKA